MYGFERVWNLKNLIKKFGTYKNSFFARYFGTDIFLILYWNLRNITKVFFWFKELKKTKLKTEFRIKN